MSEASDKTAQLLAALWARNRPLVEERLTTLDRAAEAAAGGTLNAELRGEAAGCAHKLAGSLGMYGYDDATPIARELEKLLNGGSCDADRLRELIAQLREVIAPRE